MRLIKKIFIFITLLALPLSLSAAELNNKEGWYAGAFGGLALSGNAKGYSVDLNADHKIKEKTSYGGGFSAGYRFNEMRAEFQAGYQGADIDSIRQIDTPVHSGNSNHLNAWDFMVNGYYDFKTEWVAEPFIGLGIGASIVDTKIKITTNDRLIEKSQTAFSYQGILGARYPVTDDVDLSIEYRYFSVSRFTVKDNVSDSEWKINYDRHHVMLGLNYAF
jgi:OmpA-OmpF porin, OOP family